MNLELVLKFYNKKNKSSVYFVFYNMQNLEIALPNIHNDINNNIFVPTAGIW
jgi:hypothetical protein